MAPNLALVPAGPDDWARLYAWRNDPVTRENFIQTDLVPLAEHIAYLKEAAIQPDRRLLVAYVDQVAVGTVRLDREGQTANLSLTIAPEHRRHGLARRVLQAIVARRDWFTGHVLHRFVADVKTTNLASLRAFASAGFRVVDVGDQLVKLAR